MSTPVLTTLNKAQYRTLLLVLFYAMAIGALPATSAFYILDDLGGGIATASWGVSFYVLGNFITKLLAIKIGEQVGKIKLLKICLWTVLFLNIILVISPSYYFYLTLRFLTGLVSGPLFLLITSSVGPLRPDKMHDFFLVVIAFLIFVPVLATVYGAVVAYEWTWQTSFIGLNILNFVAVLGVHIAFRKKDLPTKKSYFDSLSFIFFALAMTCLGFCLVTGQTIDGFRSIAFNILFILGLFFLITFTVRTLFQPQPIIDLHMFKVKFFPYLMFITFSVFTLFYAIIVLLSFWLHLYVSYSVTWIAYSLVAVLIGPVVAYFVFQSSGFKASSRSLGIGLFMLGVVSYSISTFNSEVNFGRIIITKLIAGVAFAMVLPSLIQHIQHSCNTTEFSKAFCLFAISRTMGSFFGVAYFIMLWERRAAFYYQRLGGQLTLFSEKTQKVLNQLNFYNFTHSMKVEGLNGALVRQSQSLALDDCYRLIAWVLMVLCVLAFAISPFFSKSLKESQDI